MQMREARTTRKITQWDMAVKTGISQSKISLMERGYVKAKPHEKEKIASVLGYPLEELFPAPGRGLVPNQPKGSVLPGR